MKFFVVAYAIFVAAQAGNLNLRPEQIAKLEEHHKICAVETNTSQKEITDARNGKFSDTPVLKQYIFCNLKRADLVNEKGILDVNVVYAKMPKGTNKLGAQVITEFCKTQEGADPADKAYNIYKCYYETTPQHIALI